MLRGAKNKHQGHTNIIKAIEIILYKTRKKAPSSAPILGTQILSVRVRIQQYLVTLWLSAQNTEPLSLVGDTVKINIKQG